MAATATGLVYSIIHTAIFERVKGRYQEMKLVGASALWGIGVTGAGALLHGLVGGAAWIGFGLTMIPLMGVAAVIIGARSVKGRPTRCEGGVNEMAAPRFRKAVKDVLLPALAPHGFVLGALPLHPVAFERTLRGHENSILISRHPFDHELFSVQLMAPKHPMGWQSRQFPGRAEYWEYHTHEELVERLQQVREIILVHGLAWLEAYTPGNVPPWEDLVEATVEAELGQALRAAREFLITRGIPWLNGEG